MSVEEKDRSYVIWLLARQNYSRHQLERKLKKSGLSLEDTKDLLDSLIQKGLFKEESFKEGRSRQLLRRGLGAPVVKAQLRRDKISLSSDDIQKTYEDLNLSPEMQVDAIIEKTLKRLKNETDPKKKMQKLTRAVVSKGHSFDTFKKCLQKFKEFF